MRYLWTATRESFFEVWRWCTGAMPGTCVPERWLVDILWWPRQLVLTALATYWMWMFSIQKKFGWVPTCCRVLQADHRANLGPWFTLQRIKVLRWVLIQMRRSITSTRSLFFSIQYCDGEPWQSTWWLWAHEADSTYPLPLWYGTKYWNDRNCVLLTNILNVHQACSQRVFMCKAPVFTCVYGFSMSLCNYAHFCTMWTQIIGPKVRTGFTFVNWRSPTTTTSTPAHQHAMPSKGQHGPTVKYLMCGKKILSKTMFSKFLNGRIMQPCRLRAAIAISSPAKTWSADAATLLASPAL